MKTSSRFAAFVIAILMAALAGCAATKTSESTGQYVDDTSITGQVKAAIFNEPGLKSAEINVETFKGVVQLSGFVKSRDDSQRAATLARSIKGVTSVKDDTRVK